MNGTRYRPISSMFGRIALFLLVLWLRKSFAFISIEVALNSTNTNYIYVEMVSNKNPTQFLLHLNSPTKVTFNEDVWEGRIWARTDCQTLDQCKKAPAMPLSVVELNVGSDVSYYDINISDGYNIGISVQPVSYGTEDKSLKCQTLTCNSKDILRNCPQELKLSRNGRMLACQGACAAFKNDEYCCRGRFSEETACKPSMWVKDYTKFFKDHCKDAATYMYDKDGVGSSCAARRYIITFFD